MDLLINLVKYSDSQLAQLILFLNIPNTVQILQLLSLVLFNRFCTFWDIQKYSRTQIFLICISFNVF